MYLPPLFSSVHGPNSRPRNAEAGDIEKVPLRAYAVIADIRHPPCIDRTGATRADGVDGCREIDIVAQCPDEVAPGPHRNDAERRAATGLQDAVDDLVGGAVASRSNN